MSNPETPASPDGSRVDARAHWLKKVHSLTGVIPLGIFLLEHLWTNAKALQGADAFTGAVDDLQALPLLPFIELFGIFLPLAYHSIYGVYLAVRWRQDAVDAGYARNWLYVLQRVSGVMTLAFIVYHLWELRLQKLLYGLQPDAFYQTLEGQLSSTHGGIPWLALVYLAGVAATVFHFANGLFSFCLTWGLTVTRDAERRVAYASGALGLVLFLLGANTVLFFATGTRLSPFARTSPLHAEAVACPALQKTPAAP